MSEENAVKEPKLSKKARILLIVMIVLVGALFIGYLVLCQMVSQSDSIWNNTKINGVALSGLTYEEATDAVQKQFENEYGEAAVSIELDGYSYKINAYQFLELDASAEIDKAYELGHGSWFASGLEWIMLQLSGSQENSMEVLPTLKEDADISGAIAQTGILDYRNMVETTYEVTETSLVVQKGKTGVVPDGEQLLTLVTEAITNLNFTDTIQCPSASETPGAPDFQAIADSIYREPSNATLDPANGYAIVASVTGISLDVQAASAAYEAAEEGTAVEIPLAVTDPGISTADMEANLFVDLLGTYQSTVTGSSGKRTNIGLASDFCNGVVLMPGETFSYNGVVGETTAERGFQSASVYLNGEVEQELGGGVCQVSSTIFAALLYTDIEITQRQCHSMIVTYVPYGMDATVYWTQPDFRFTNNHNYPIRLNVTFENSVITVQVWGTDESDYTVDCRVEQTGELSFVTYRDYFDADGNLVESEYIGSSRYKPVS